jgi:hypothetical protein
MMPGQFDLPKSGRSPPPQQGAPLLPVVPIHPDVFKKGDYQTLEEMVDQFIQANKLKEGDGFQIPYPGGAKTFEYLGPGSGGRKDWMEKGPPPAAPLTS